MKAEKITQTAEAFNENVSNSMKWFQESSSVLFETQSKQIKFATDMYVNLLNSYFGNFETKNYANPTFGAEKMTEMITMNINHISKMTEENLKVLNDFSTQAASAFFVKESMEKLIDFYKKQVEMMNTFNQNAVGAFMKETEISNMFMKPFSQNLKNEFGLTSQLFNEGFKDLVASFSNFSNPSLDTNKQLMGDVAHKMQSMFKNSIDLWADILNSYNARKNNVAEPIEKPVKHQESAKEHHVSAKNKLHAVHI